MQSERRQVRCTSTVSCAAMRVRRRAYWTPAPVRVRLDLSVGSHLPEGDDIGASTVGAVGALSLLPPILSTIQRPDDRTDRASGDDDVASGPSSENYVLR